MFSQFKASEESKQLTWHEISRPQVHGYDMNCLAIVKSPESENNKLASKILSGGDEKVLRVFEAPYNFIKTINDLSPFKPELVYS